MNPTADTPNPANPVGVMVRIAGLAGLTLLCLGLWPILRSTPGFIGEAFRGPWRPGDVAITFAMTAFGAAFFAALGWMSAWAVWRPTRIHLALAVIAGLGTAWAWGYEAAVAPAIDSLIADRFEPLGRTLVSRLCFLAALVSMVAAEWKLSAWAGYRDPDDRFWTARNVRPACVVLGWFLFFAMPMGNGSAWSPLESVLEPAWLVTFNRYGNLIWILFCLAVGKLLPPMLIRVTGIDPDPRRDRPAVLEWHAKPNDEASEPTEG